MSNRGHRRRRILFFVDPIESSSYPVTETGYALLYRAWMRARQDGSDVYAVYPNTKLKQVNGRATWTVDAHRIEHFFASPYEHFNSQRQSYDAATDVGSARCHHESGPETIPLTDADAIVFRQETGASDERTRLLRALASVEKEVLVYLSPTLALDPRFGSKALPAQIAPDRVPLSFDTRRIDDGVEAKINAALAFVEQELGAPATFMAKPACKDNGIGITACGRRPIDEMVDTDPRAELLSLYQAHGEFMVQEYVASVRAPEDVPVEALGNVPSDRRDFGEIRFLLIDGLIPRTREGGRISVARRTPAPNSLIADSGISYATTLSAEECAFLDEVGRAYLRRGIHFGGGDLIRTPDPKRPFLFTDAARSVCGHAVVTGALNGEPYLIIDQVLDSIERQLFRRAASKRVDRVPLPA